MLSIAEGYAPWQSVRGDVLGRLSPVSSSPYTGAALESSAGWEYRLRRNRLSGLYALGWLSPFTARSLVAPCPILMPRY